MKADWIGVGVVYRACVKAASIIGLRPIDRNPEAGSSFARRFKKILRKCHSRWCEMMRQTVQHGCLIVVIQLLDYQYLNQFREIRQRDWRQSNRATGPASRHRPNEECRACHLCRSCLPPRTRDNLTRERNPAASLIEPSI